MQTAILPILSGASASANAAPRPNSEATAHGAGQFSQALSREVAQRQNAGAPAKPAQSSQPPAPQQQQRAAQAAKTPDAPAAPQRPAKPSVDKSEDSTAADAARVDDGADEAAAAAAATPVADMLALVASFNQPAAPAPGQADAAASAVVALGGRARGAALPSDASLDAATAAAGAAFEHAVARAGEHKDGLGAGLTTAADAKTPAGKDGLADPLAAAQHRLKGDAGADPKPDGAAADARPLAAGAAAKAEPAHVTALHAREEAPVPAALKDPAGAVPLNAPLSAQSAFAVAQAAAPAASDKINARVGTPGWDNQVGQKIVWMVAGKEQSAELTLNPPDMGPMQVVLSVTNDQASVTFTAAQPEVRQALEAAMPKLREMMSESGIALGNATVNAGLPDQRQAQGEQPRAGLGNANGRFDAGADTAGAPPTRPARRTEQQGLVDTFA